MDSATGLQLTNRFIALRNITSIVLILICLGVLRRYSSFLIFVITLGVIFFFILHLEKLKRYSGYGVAEKINTLVKAPIVPVVSVTKNRFAPHTLIRTWLRRLMGCFGIMSGEFLARHFGYYHGEIPLSRIALLLIALLIAEVIVWLFIERQRLWYIHEDQVRSYMIQERWGRIRIDSAITRMKEAGVLIYGIPRI